MSVTDSVDFFCSIVECNFDILVLHCVQSKAQILAKISPVLLILQTICIIGPTQNYDSNSTVVVQKPTKLCFVQMLKHQGNQFVICADSNILARLPVYAQFQFECATREFIFSHKCMIIHNYTVRNIYYFGNQKSLNRLNLFPHTHIHTYTEIYIYTMEHSDVLYELHKPFSFFSFTQLSTIFFIASCCSDLCSCFNFFWNSSKRPFLLR